MAAAARRRRCRPSCLIGESIPSEPGRKFRITTRRPNHKNDDLTKIQSISAAATRLRKSPNFLGLFMELAARVMRAYSISAGGRRRRSASTWAIIEAVGEILGLDRIDERLRGDERCRLFVACAHPFASTPTIHHLKQRLFLRLIRGKLDREPADIAAIDLDKNRI
jgi:hypothetical protein